MKNDRIILADRNGSTALVLWRDKGGCSAYIEDRGGEEMGLRLDDASLARLRTWLNTGISPSRLDLVDPVPPVVDEVQVATFDPQPRDLRADRAPERGQA